MKKWTHLYVFLVLSGISTISRLWTAFFSRFNEEQLAPLKEALPAESYNELVTIQRETIGISTGIVSKLFAVVLFAALVAVVVLLVKKQAEKASLVYIGYLFGTLLQATHVYIAMRGLANVYSDPMMRATTNQTTLVVYIFSIVLFAVYLGLTLFFHYRKPKETPSMAQNATDI